jgi:hypothetical protein
MILLNQVEELPDLIHLCLPTVRLQVQTLWNVRVVKDAMAASDASQPETESFD